MSDDLSEHLASLRALAPKLNRATDEAAQTVNEVNAFLEELSIGLTAWVEYDRRRSPNPDPDGPKMAVVNYLQYGRFQGKFQIHVAETTFTVDEEGDIRDAIEENFVAWSTLPREGKLDSAAAIPELIKRIAEEAQSKADRLDQSRQRVRAAMGDGSARPAGGEVKETAADRPKSPSPRPRRS